MAENINNPLLVNVRGKFAGIVVYKQIGGRSYMTKPHSKHRTQSALQKVNRYRFKEASAFAHEQLRDPVKLEYYEQLAMDLKLTNAYTAALTERLREIREQMKRPSAGVAVKSLKAKTV